MEILRLIAKLMLDDKPFTDGMKRAESSAERLESTLGDAERQAEQFDEALDQAGASASATANTLDRKTAPAVEKTGAQLRSGAVDATRFRDALKSAGEAATTIGSQLSVAVTAPLAAFGITALKTAGDFEASMNRVAGITSATGDAFERLEGLALELGASTVFSASQAADAMGNLATAGFDVEEIYDALPGVLNLAASSGLDLAEASGIVATALRGFGLEASEVGRVNDVISKTSISANTDVRQLGEAFTYVAPIAQGLGFEFEETSAAVGLISDAGIQASMAGTGLRAIFTTLATRADDVGVAVRDAAGNMLPLADILQQLEANGYTAEEAMQTFGETGGPALVALLAKGSDSVRELTGELDNASGTAERLAATRMEGLNGALAELASAFEGLQIAVANSGLQEWVEQLVVNLTGLINRVAALDPEFLRIATVVGIVVAAIGPLLVVFGQLVTTLTAVRTGLIALRTIALAMAGPAGWITLGVTAVVALGAAFLATRDDASELDRQLAETARTTAEHNARINAATTAYEEMREQATAIIGPVNDMRADIVTSTGSVEDLRAAVERAARGMDEDAATAFRTFAEEAIASGEDLEVVGQKIADRAMRTSLISRVNELAAGLDGEGRTAFINYGLQAIATAETAQEALEAIMRAWSAAINAAEIGELTIANTRLRAEIDAQRLVVEQTAAAQQDLNAEYETSRARLEELRAIQNDRNRTLSDDQVDELFRLQRLVEAQGELGDAARGSVEELAAQEAALRTLESRFAENETQIATLRGEYLEWNAITVQETVPAVREVERVTRSATAATQESTRASSEQRNEAQEALTAAAAAAAAADKAIADINRANVEATAGISAAVDAAIEYSTAQSAALQAQSEAAIAYVASVIATTQALIGNLRDFAFDIEGFYENLTSSIEDALSDTTDITLNLTRQAELLVDEILGSTAAMLQQADATVANLTEEADEIVSGALEDLAEGNERIIESANETVTALQAEATAILEFMQGVFNSTNELADQIVEDTEAIRQGIEATNDAAANETFPDYARLAQSTKELAAETADLTLRKLALGEATRSEAIAALDAYIPFLQAELEFVQADTVAYIELREELERVLDLKNAIVGGGTGEGGLSGGGGIVAGVTEGIRSSLDAFANTINGFVGNLASFGAVAAGLIETIASNVPVIGDALSAFTLKFNEGTGALEASFNPLTLFTNILASVINSSEAVRGMFDRLTTALTPFIEVVGEAIVNAFEPLLTVVVQLMNALSPIIQVAVALLNTALQPLVWVLQTIVVPVFTFVANIIRAIWNGIATALNTILRIFGVNIPTIPEAGATQPGAGGGGAGGGGAGGGGGTQEEAPEGTIGSSNGVYVIRNRDGIISVLYGNSAPPGRSIARERATISALNQAYANASTGTDRAQIRDLLDVHQARLDELTSEGQPAESTPETAPPGRIEELRQQRAEAVRRRDAARTDEEIRAANEEIRAIDEEIRRLESLGAPSTETPEEPPAPGLLNQLQRDRAAAVKRLQEATTEDEIRAANAEIREIDAKIARLRALGAPTPDRGGDTVRAPRRPRGGGSIFVPAPTPTPAPTPVTPPAPPPERPVVFPDDGLNFATVTQSVQFAVATPLVEASLRMVEAARLFSGAFGNAETGGLFAAVPPFTAVLERLTPVLDRLLVEGVDVNVGTTAQSASRGITLTNALRPL